MKKGIIYIYTNLLNNKIYIGQTTTSLKRRHQKHLSQLNDNTYFHRAIKKYGINNFKLEVLEDNIDLSILDEREKYWIKQKNAFYKNGQGYNLTQGGQWGSGTQLICGSAEEEIKELIKNSELTFKQIGDLYGVSLSCISDINRGRSFYDAECDYPIRKTPQKTQLNSNLVNTIIDLLINSPNLSITDIGLTLGISSYTVGEINRGKNSWCTKEYKYPLRKGVQQNTYQNKIDQEQVIEICHLLIFSSKTLSEIGKQFNIAKNTVGDISRGISWKNITQNFITPIRKNKIQNQEIYKTLYGIV